MKSDRTAWVMRPHGSPRCWTRTAGRTDLLMGIFDLRSIAAGVVELKSPVGGSSRVFTAWRFVLSGGNG